jgi:hypothetical protein
MSYREKPLPMIEFYTDIYQIAEKKGTLQSISNQMDFVSSKKPNNGDLCRVMEMIWHNRIAYTH